MLGVCIDTSNDGDVNEREACINGNLLYLLADGVQLTLNLGVLQPKCLDWPSHQAVDIGHEKRQTRTSNCLKHRLGEVNCSVFNVGHDFDEVKQETTDDVILLTARPLDYSSAHHHV